jgi:hypothetical protein
MFIVASSVMPDNFDKRENLREGHDLFVKLKDDGVVETTFLVDNLGPFARRYSLAVMDAFQSKALASLLAAQAHFSRNPSLAEVGRSLGDYAALVGMAFASRQVAVAKEVWGWPILRWGLKELPYRGTGDLANVVLEAREATTTALTDPQALAIQETIDLGKPFYVVYTAPLSRRDAQGWGRFSNQIRTWLANTFPTAIPVFVSGNGTPDPRYTGPYWVQATVLFPMPDVPAPLGAILAGQSQKRRPSGTSVSRVLMSSGNGHTPDSIPATVAARATRKRGGEATA